MSSTMNRAQRRKIAAGCRPHGTYLFPLQDAMAYNLASPVPGLVEVFDWVMMRYGMDVQVALCGECGEVTVLV